jgi:hypothetical protein
MKPYAVEVSFTMIVMAESPKHATEVAENSKHDAFYGEPNHELSAPYEIRDVCKLAGIGWDGTQVPYGGDGETTLADIIAELNPERDTRTIDMFSQQAS